MYTLAYSKIIRSDVRSSYIYIKEKLESPMAAENLIIELINKLNYLKETPLTRPLVQDGYLASFEYRSIKVKDYVLYYIVDDGKKKVNIIRFLYNKRDWINILKENNINEIM
jgi:plasmid stabilization system protein ParE